MKDNIYWYIFSKLKKKHPKWSKKQVGTIAYTVRIRNDRDNKARNKATSDM